MKVENGILKEINTIDILTGNLYIPASVKILDNNCLKNLNINKLVIPDNIEECKDFSISDTNIETLIFQGTPKISDNAIFNNKILRQIIFEKHYNIKAKMFVSNQDIVLIKNGDVDNVVYNMDNILYKILGKSSAGSYNIYKLMLFDDINTLNPNKYFLCEKKKVTAVSSTIREAIKKCNSNYLMINHLYEKYKDISLDYKISLSEFKEITGACEKGTNEWLINNNYSVSDKIKIRDLLTKIDNDIIYKDFTQFIADCYANRAK